MLAAIPGNHASTEAWCALFHSFEWHQKCCLCLSGASCLKHNMLQAKAASASSEDRLPLMSLQSTWRGREAAIGVTLLCPHVGVTFFC